MRRWPPAHLRARMEREALARGERRRAGKTSRGLPTPAVGEGAEHGKVRTSLE